MGKVILITSREFVKKCQDDKCGFTSLELEARTEEVSDALMGGRQKYVLGYWGLFKDEPWNVSFQTDASKETISQTIKAKQIKNSATNLPYFVGVFKKEIGEDVVYIADEYPFKVFWFEEDEQKYLNALIEEIMNEDENNENKQWIFISHDKDWGQNVNWTELYKEKNPREENPRNAIKEKFKSLNEINELKTTRVFVFQHDNNSPIYNELLGWFQNNCSEAIPIDKILGLF